MASNNLFLSLKVSLITVSVLSFAITLKLYLPLLCDYMLSELPLLWISLRSWLTPPYLYFVINFIIVTIAATSRYQQKLEEQVEGTIPEPVKIQPEILQNYVVYEDEPAVLKTPVNSAVEIANRNPVTEVSGYDEEETRVMVIENKQEEETVVDGEVEEFVDSGAKEMPIVRTESAEYSLFSKEKPPVSGRRFGHRKIAKGNPEGGKSLRVAKPPKRQDTLESTWKMITEGRSMPLARHLKKSETWDSNDGPQDTLVTKSDTFNSRTNTSSTLARSQGGSGKLKKEPSLSQDDLNRRVEAFINKFNEEMRLQRLESLNRYKEMTSSGGAP